MSCGAVVTTNCAQSRGKWTWPDNTHAGWYAAESVGRWGDDFIVVQNPFAASPLPRGFFPRGREFIAEDAGDGTLELVEVGEVEPAGT